MARRHSWALVLLLFLATSVLAEHNTQPTSIASTSGQFPVTVYRGGENGPDSSIACIAEDQFGRIYAAGYQGIWRFDGHTWEPFASGHCMAVCFDGSTHLYAIVDGVCGKWRIEEETAGEFTPLTGAISKATADIASDEGLSDDTEIELSELTLTPASVNGRVYFLGSNHLLCLASDSAGDYAKIWTKDDLPVGFRFRGVGQFKKRPIVWFLPATAKEYRLAEILDSGGLDFTEELRAEPGGSLSGFLSGVARVTSPSGEERLALVTRKQIAFLSSLDDATITTITPDYGQEFFHQAVATWSGGVAIKSENDGLILTDHQGNVQVQIPATDIARTAHQLFTDSRGRLWLPAFHCVYRVDPGQRILHWQGQDMPDPRQIVHFDSHIVVAHSRGISVANFDPKTGLPTEPFRSIAPTDARDAHPHRTYSAHVVDDTLFLGQVSGLYSLDSIDDYIQRSSASRLEGYCLGIIPTDSSDTVFALRFQSPSSTLVREQSGRGNRQWSPGDEIRCFSCPKPGGFLDADGYIWITGSSTPLGAIGIQRIDLASGQVETFECTTSRPSIFQFDGHIFYSGAERRRTTDQAMFHKFDRLRSRFEPTDYFEDLENRLAFDDSTSQLLSVKALQDGSALFTFTDQYLIHGARDEAGHWSLRSVVGLGPQGVARASYQDRYKNCWLLAGQRIYCKVGGWSSTLRLKTNPQLVVNSLKLSGNALKLEGQPGGGDGVSTDYTNDAVTLNFSMPGSATPQTDRYRYRLVGQAEAWSPWSKHPAVDFPALREGSYTLELQGMQNFESQSPIRQIALSVAPPWFRSWWLRASVTFATLLLGTIVLHRLAQRQNAKVDTLQNKINQLHKDHAEAQTLQAQIIERERAIAVDKAASEIAKKVGNTLTPIMTYGEELAGGQVSAGQTQKYGSAISEGVQDASEIIRLAQPSYRGLTRRPQQEQLDDTVREVADSLRQIVATEFPSHNIVIYTQALPVSAPFCIEDMQELLHNLARNAIEAIETQGTVGFVCRRENGHALLEIRDNGSGMTNEVKNKCLTPFYSTKGPGRYGLGMTVAQSIVAAYGGILEVESKPGDGTCIRVLIPREQPTPKPVVSEGDNADASRIHILVVDSVFRTRDAIRHQLEVLGHDVIAADGPTSALEQLNQKQFDLITSDDQFENMPGLKFHRQLRDAGYSGPVIFIASNQHSATLKAGDALLLKPTSITELQRCLATLASSKRTTQSRSTTNKHSK